MTQADPKDLPGSPRARHSFKEPIRVEIDDEDFAERGRNNPIWRGHNIAKLLIDAGIPIWLGGGVVSFKSVDHGRLSMWCEKRDGRLWRVYEWTPDAMTTGAVESVAVKFVVTPKPAVKKPAVVPFDEEEDEL